MSAAGGKLLLNPEKRGISDVWNLGSQYNNEYKLQSDSLNSKDINGDIKRNQFGAVLQTSANYDPNTFAGEIN